MFSGDSLTILLFLAGTMIAAAIGAISAQPGWRSTTLWVVSGVFGLVSFLWLIAPSASPIIQALMPIATAAVQSGAFMMVGTVGIVALMSGGRAPAPAKGTDIALITPPPPRPDFAPAKPAPTKWVPDTSLMDAMIYLYQESRWSEQGRREFIDVKVKFLMALQESQLLAWGKTHPDDGEAFQIRSDFWIDVEITPQSNTVFSKTRNVNAYEVKLCLNQIELAWPRKPEAQA